MVLAAYAGLQKAGGSRGEKSAAFVQPRGSPSLATTPAQRFLHTLWPEILAQRSLHTLRTLLPRDFCVLFCMGFPFSGHIPCPETPHTLPAHCLKAEVIFLLLVGS